VDNLYVTIEVPDVTPQSRPVPEPIEATPVLLLLHVPDAVASLRLVHVPAQREVIPIMAAGIGFTVNTIVA
jgi:hypothetical protein